jgi:hypothetical protein
LLGLLLRMLRYPGPMWLSVLMCEQRTDVLRTAAEVPLTPDTKKDPCNPSGPALSAGPS